MPIICFVTFDVPFP